MGTPSVVAMPSDGRTAVGTAVWAGLAIASFLAWIRLEPTEILFLLAKSYAGIVDRNRAAWFGRSDVSRRNHNSTRV
jgi:hypothetical protein